MTETQKPKFDVGRELYDWAQAMVNAIIVVILLFAFIASMYSVKGDSMVPTLRDKEMLIISRLFYTPSGGDIVLFNKPGLGYLSEDASGRESPFVKRVIAVGGDSVDYDYERNMFVINGELLEEHYIAEDMLPKGDYPFLVPEGYLFCCGDNRNLSLDSRDGRVGLVNEEYVLGKVLFRVMPLDKIGTLS